MKRSEDDALPRVSKVGIFFFLLGHFSPLVSHSVLFSLFSSLLFRSLLVVRV